MTMLRFPLWLLQILMAQPYLTTRSKKYISTRGAVQGCWSGSFSLPLKELNKKQENLNLNGRQQRNVKHCRQNQQLKEGVYWGWGDTPAADTQRKDPLQSRWGALRKKKSCLFPRVVVLKFLKSFPLLIQGWSDWPRTVCDVSWAGLDLVEQVHQLFGAIRLLSHIRKVRKKLAILEIHHLSLLP